MKAIVPYFKSLVGFQADANFPTMLTEEDKTTDSGLYFQELHPLVNLYNIRAVAPFISGSEMTDSQLRNWLIQKEESAILKVLIGVRKYRNLQEIDKTLLDRSLIYDGYGTIREKEIKENRFVGYQIVLKNPDQLILSLNQICFQFDEINPSLDIYFYHSSQDDFVFKKQFSTSRANLPNWLDGEDLELIAAKSQLFGGFWIVGYYEEDLVGQAINKTGFDYIKGGCNCGQIDPWKQWSKYVSLQPIFVPSNQIEETRLCPNEETFTYSKDKSYGLNFMFSVGCSIHNIFLNQKSNFAQAIQLQFNVDMLHEIAYSTRTSAITEKLQQKAMYDLEDKENTLGLKTKLEKEIKSINISLEKLGSICTPKFAKINYTAI